jgi:hypothetical protein
VPDGSCLLRRDLRHGLIAALPRNRFVTQARRLGAERLTGGSQRNGLCIDACA